MARLSPLFGFLTLFYILQADSGNGAWVEIWRVLLSVGLGVVVTLLGMLHHNSDRRISIIEERYISREEYNVRHLELVEHLKRIETHLEKTDDRIHDGRT